MGLIQLKGSALHDALRAGVKAICDDIKAATAKGRETGTEYRDRVFQGFLKLFEAYKDNSTTDKVKYLVPMKLVAEDTGYSLTMVNHYRTIAENMELRVQVGVKPGKIENTPDGVVQGESEPIFAVVGEIYRQADIGDLSTSIRRTLNAARGGRPKPSADVLGARAEKSVLTMKEGEQATWLKGFCKSLAAVNRLGALQSIASKIEAQATKKGKGADVAQDAPAQIATA